MSRTPRLLIILKKWGFMDDGVSIKSLKTKRTRIR